MTYKQGNMSENGYMWVKVRSESKKYFTQCFSLLRMHNNVSVRHRASESLKRLAGY